MAFSPDPKAYAEVCYVLPDGGMFRAVVYRSMDGWELKTGRIQNTIGFLPAGTFSNGKALVKFIRERAKKVVGDVPPIYDTLHKLLTSSPMSVVPDCYEPVLAMVLDLSGGTHLEGRGLPSCPSCPYRSKCGEPSAQPEIIPVEEVVEPEEVFMRRLQLKIKNRYGVDDD